MHANNSVSALRKESKKLSKWILYQVGGSILMVGFLIGEVYAHNSGSDIGLSLLIPSTVILAFLAVVYFRQASPRQIDWSRWPAILSLITLGVFVGSIYLMARSRAELMHDAWVIDGIGLATLGLTFFFSGDLLRLFKPKKKSAKS